MLANEGLDLDVAASALEGVPAAAARRAVVEQPLIDDVRVDDGIAAVTDREQILEGQLVDAGGSEPVSLLAAIYL